VTGDAATKWADVDLGAISHNVGLVKDLVGPSTAVMAVVKANGYGHGAVPSAQAALAGGATWLGVSSVAEGLELRQAGIGVPILNLGYTPPAALPAAIAARLSLTLYDQASLEALRRTGSASAVHVKINSGMHRLGAPGGDAVRLVRELLRSPNLRLEGFWTHFASAESDPDFTRRQLDSYLEARTQILREGARGFISHAANSAGLLRLPEARLDMVRAGLVIYGVRPVQEWRVLPSLRPALSWHALVTNVQQVPVGGTVGYGRRFTATQSTRIATLAAGYADGLHRRLSNRGRAIVRGQLVPIVGTISMDQAAVDVTGVPGVEIGDIACLIGSDGEARWQADDVAEASDTISYEVLCAISARVPRRYRNL
jgi:alanine racemase